MNSCTFLKAFQAAFALTRDTSTGKLWNSCIENCRETDATNSLHDLLVDAKITPRTEAESRKMVQKVFKVARSEKRNPWTNMQTCKQSLLNRLGRFDETRAKKSYT